MPAINSYFSLIFFYNYSEIAISVGAGGVQAGYGQQGNNGVNSVFGDLEALGGGGMKCCVI